MVRTATMVVARKQNCGRAKRSRTALRRPIGFLPGRDGVVVVKKTRAVNGGFMT